MFENIMKFFKKMMKKENASSNSKNTAKERLHLVLVQDRANVSADFLELMKQEIIEVIKKYIEIDENLIDVRLTNHGNEDGTNGAPALYANIPIKNIKESARKVDKIKEKNEDEKSKEVNKTEQEENDKNKAKEEQELKEEKIAKEEQDVKEKIESEDNKKVENTEDDEIQETISDQKKDNKDKEEVSVDDQEVKTEE